jgi:1-phosphatidylinositol-3-phosphate 5-kinase
LELFRFSTARSSSGSQFSTPLNSPPEQTPSSSFFSVATGYRLFISGSRNQPDPDQEGVVWNEPEQYYSVISRKESSRESRLGMRDILRQTTLPEPSLIGASTPVVRGLSNSSAQAIFAKAKTEIVSEAANSKVSEPDTLATVDLLVLQELTAITTSRPPSVKTSAPDSLLADSDLESEKAPSITSVEGGGSEETVRKDKGQDDIPLTNPPLPPKKEFVGVGPSIPSKEPEEGTATSTSFATILANGINSAVRFVTHTESTSGTVSRSPSIAKHHLLLADISNIDERPHIKYEWTIGKRIKFSCTVYYAKQFDALRRRCGVNDLFLKSLASSMNWIAQGGKSKSNFWKTSDDRFIIKSLVNAWNVADLYVPNHVLHLTNLCLFALCFRLLDRF